MATLAKHLILCSTATSSSSSASSPTSARRRGTASQADAAAAAGERHQRGAPQSATRRLAVAASTALAATAALSARRPAAPPPAMAAEAAAVPPPPPGPGTVPRWGTRSYVRERFFEPGLTAEEAAARIRQTAEGMRTLRPMLETMSWKYVLFYVRLKSKYLDLDLTTAMAGVPEARRPDYVRVANELVDNMTEFDRFVRTPKVYESYLYYEKTLKSLDDVTEFLA
ncbi:photosynthetic NDH subunit of lumenal location 2, chloroplastic [Oryza glaberrima]|uniref:photosynthetic NDH subunit of lumenal location 2, chloroplastic n=1 Tax=Oryza glaberrima TaxID=4538 RepID=UPI00224C2A5B|nr:photosynthetic NDH subunit of lumenal location 2, chloroplastic [Oryza glaberrima]